jgi:hypothetical protein
MRNEEAAMRSRQQLLAIVTGLCTSFGVEAAGPTATAVFEIQDPVTHKYKPATDARLDQYLCLRIDAVLVPDGEHSVQLTIYDGLGNEVIRSTRRGYSSNLTLGRIHCLGFDEDHDAPGTWWYVVELDGQPLLSASIEVRPARSD